jgi:hypothetical protein
MGPRLLYEAAPAWCLLLAAAVVEAVRAIPEDGGVARGILTRRGVVGAFALALIVVVTYSGPRKLASYQSVGELSGMTLPVPASEGPSLVFVHGTWEDRVAARLAASGMRVDSIRSALAHTSTCRLELYLARIEAGDSSGRSAELAGAEPVFQEGRGSPLQEFRMPSGSVIRSYENETLDPACERQAASDFEGAVGLPPFLWQGDLPGLGATGDMFVRDLGPERNARLIGTFPDREPKVLLSRGGVIDVVPYGPGMEEIWSDG